MRKKLKDLRFKQNQIAQSMRDMVTAAENEERGLTDEERGIYDTKMGEYDSLQERIGNLEGIVDLASIDPGKLDSEEARKLLSQSDGDLDAGDLDSDQEDRAGAFGRLLRSSENGLQGLSDSDRKHLRELAVRAMAAGTGSAGGYTVPQGFGDQVFETMKMYGGIMRRCEVLDTASGNDLPYPTLDDTSNIGALLAENVEDSEQDVAFGQKILEAHKYTSKIVRVSIELLQDSGIPIEAVLTRLLGARIGRAASVHYATGSGSGQPEGLFTAAATGKTAAAADEITYMELLDLEHSIDPAYRMLNPVWVMNDASLKSVRQLVDGNSIPLWQPRIADRAPATINGFEYEIDQASPAMTTGLKPIAFGDLKQFFVRRVLDVTLSRLVERYAEFHQVGFVSIARTDSGLMDTSAIKVLEMA